MALANSKLIRIKLDARKIGSLLLQELLDLFRFIANFMNDILLGTFYLFEHTSKTINQLSSQQKRRSHMLNCNSQALIVNQRNNRDSFFVISFEVIHRLFLLITLFTFFFR